MSDTNMSEEAAEKEFERWAESQDFEFDNLDEKNATAVAGFRKTLVKSFMKGTLVFNDDGNLEYTVSERSPSGYAGDKVTITSMTGKVWMAMDGYKDTEQMHKIVAAASAITGKDHSWFSQLSGKDFNLFASVVGLFLNA